MSQTRTARDLRAFLRPGEKLLISLKTSAAILKAIELTGTIGLSVQWMCDNTPSGDDDAECADCLGWLLDHGVIIKISYGSGLENTRFISSRLYYARHLPL